MYPDDVAGALQLDGLARDLAGKGWEVEAFPCNRGRHDGTKVYAPSDIRRGVSYRRVWRPGFSQEAFSGRLANSLWMILAWSRLAFRGRRRRPSVIVIGTDPVFAAVAAIPLRLFAPGIRLAHWCFDMHPEAAVVNGIKGDRALTVRLARAAMRRAYRSFDLIADLGVCMRGRLRRYDHGAIECELTPWAPVEPDRPVAPDPDTRHALFGDARLGILYSGNFGEAHDFRAFLALARALRGNPQIRFCFAVRGSRAAALRSAVTAEDTNIAFAGFVSAEDLGKRLGSADIHLVSLKREWSGIAVPSKFFGAIASGRPVLYAGPRGNSIGNWIERHGIGWIMDPDDISGTARRIADLSRDASEIARIRRHCHGVYRKHFSRRIITERWNEELVSLLEK